MEDTEKKVKVKKVTIKRAIRAMTAKLQELPPESEEATKIANNIKTLSEALEKSSKSKDTVIAAGASVFTAGMLIAFERNNPITTKLLGFIPKLRIH